MNFNQAARVSANPVKYCHLAKVKAYRFFYEENDRACTNQFIFECDTAMKRIADNMERSDEHICNERESCSVCKGAL